MDVISFLTGAATMLSVLGLLAAVIAPSVDRWSKRFFITFFAALVVFMAFFLLEERIYTDLSKTALLKLLYYLDSLLPVCLFLLLTAYLLHLCGERWQISTAFRIAAALGGVYFILLNLTQFIPLFYDVAPDNELIIGPWYPLSVLPVLGILLVDLILVVRRRSKLSAKFFFGFLICLLPPTLAIVVHLLIFSFPLTYLGMTITAFSMYVIIQLDQLEQHLRQQREIAQQNASILVLQMRPHFIYNTMTSVYCLCNQDPQKARQVTLDFTTYLRKNFTAIASEDVIPFTEELEHARAYLSVEQAQFEDSLFIEYDTPHVQFRIPPLTLQPIVENAVKHGLDPESDSLHIAIRTRETKNDSEILVEDDGAGFELPEDHQPHIALSNIRKRLEMMCGGSLTILPREDGGTVVKVKIPKRAGLLRR